MARRTDVRAEIRRVARTLDEVGRKHIPAAAALAINRTLEEIQTAQRKRDTQVFTQRRPAWQARLVKINPAERATAAKLVGVVGIQGPGADVFTKFEDGGPKQAVGGHRFAIPAGIRSSATQVLGPSQRPRALLADYDRWRAAAVKRAFGGRRKPRSLFKAGPKLERPRIFLLNVVSKRTGTPLGLILQRLGRGAASKLKTLYAISPKARTPKVLEFYGTAETVTRARFAVNLRGFVAVALRDGGFRKPKSP